MLSRFARTISFSTAILAMFAISMAGCSSSTTPPDSDATYAPNVSLLNRTASGKLTVLEGETLETSVALTSEFGGSLDVGDEEIGTSGLDVPEGAVDEIDDGSSVSFVKMKVTKIGEITAELTPHGRTFNKPVWLKLSYKGADLGGVDESTLAIFYWNEEISVWELVPGGYVNTDQDFVAAPLDHFSKYGVGSDE